jgi:ALpha-l-arabinofuranosidase b (abfb) family
MSKSMRKILIIILLFAIGFPSYAQNEKIFRQWGEESLKVIDLYLKSNRGTFLYAEKSTSPTAAFVWPTGIQLKALIYADRMDDAKKLLDNVNKYYYVAYNGYYAYDASYNGKGGSRYYDDNAWMVKDLLDMYAITKNEDYLTRAKTVLKFCMSGELPTGGILFNENPNHEKAGKWSVCATAPTIVCCLRLYQITNLQKYLNDALRLYQFLKNDAGWGIGAGYRGYENAVVMQASMLLYTITKEEQYLEDAYRLAYGMESHYIDWATHRLNETGQWGAHDMADAYVELYKIDHNPRWLNLVAGYAIYLHDNCKDELGFYPEYWNDLTPSQESRQQLLYQSSAASTFLKLASVSFEAEPVTTPVAIFQNVNYNQGKLNNQYSVGLEVGEYTQDDLWRLGLTDNKMNFKAQISSIEIADGYKVTIYKEGDFTGDSRLLYKSSPDLQGWSNVKSLVVARVNDTGIHSNNSSSSLKVHPQQTSDFVCIENLSEDTCIKVLDMNGNTVFRTNVSDEQYVLDMTPFSQGMYLVVISEQGQSQSVKVLKY